MNKIIDIVKMDIVIAWYNEPNILDWLSKVSKKNRVFLYIKGDCSDREKELLYKAGVYKIRILENIGREAHTWLEYIIERLETGDIPNKFVLLQGDPFFHLSNCHKALKNNYDEFAYEIENHSCNQVEPLLCPLYCEVRPPPFHVRVDVESAWKRLFESVRPPLLYEFAAGAQYICSKECILSKDLDWWKRVLDMIIKDEINAWEIERLWIYIFKHVEKKLL